MRFGTAFRAFWAAIVSAEKASALDAALAADTAGNKQLPAPPVSAGEPPPTHKATPASKLSSQRSDALTLLATLQREARLLDLIQEDLSGYGDADVGAAARTVIADSRKVLQRLFAIEPATTRREGDVIASEEIDQQHFRIAGSKSSASHYRIVHPGWKATRQEVPVWTGDAKSADVIAPAEIEADA